MTEIAVTDQHVGFLNIQTGELLPATPANAAQVLLACRAMKEHVNDLVNEATAFLVSEAERLGTKTIHAGDHVITLNGGTSEEYDPHDLSQLLRECDCPEDRIEQAVVAEVTYKVNRSVLRQLAAANPNYRAAVELARREVEKPYRATVKTAGRT